ncbi:4-alpha-glucanotransferase [Rubripirellula obstinata]|uniref:4-alpha-glucanotransferase n=1 Tax=Rubripirellula obstinata TaxID=406547 RepID=A0A5B1CNZ3_9BACT|nr:4-alpha-glucanotransferase [Rubripirellula obstinata]KAA1261320.1 4-alpha-glucanotransferase [Rubripirellula obstinata]
MVLSARSSGILLHPTSLPSPHGIGDLGAGAYRFIDYLVTAKQRLWQVLPLNPTGFGNSPYSATSAFAGNPLLIDLVRVAEEVGCLEAIGNSHRFCDQSVDYESVTRWKMPILRHCADQFLGSAKEDRRLSYQRFCLEHQDWLEDYAMFVSIKQHFDRLGLEQGCDSSAWNLFWDKGLAQRNPESIRQWSDSHCKEIETEKVLQFFFFEQWLELKKYANQRGIQIVGDVPIFVAMDSADVWSSPNLFLLDDQLQPVEVAGVPPDYFSETGQRWGNPLYDWDEMRKDQFAWWARRFRGLLNIVDVVRIDHFRGFQACWSIPAAEDTAVNGRWVNAPGDEVFSTIRQANGAFPIIAEDLGVITPEVEAMRDRHGFPGMRILQFGFDPSESRSDHFLPHRYIPNCVVYTGTHDNDTVKGWYDAQGEDVRRYVDRYLNRGSGQVAWDFIKAAMASVANTVVLPMQDVLNLGSESRLNTPATINGNWGWRLQSDQLSDSTATKLGNLVVLYQRTECNLAAAQETAQGTALGTAQGPGQINACENATDQETSLRIDGSPEANGSPQPHHPTPLQPIV